jgi:hypothetical protein
MGKQVKTQFCGAKLTGYEDRVAGARARPQDARPWGDNPKDGDLHHNGSMTGRIAAD